MGCCIIALSHLGIYIFVHNMTSYAINDITTYSRKYAIVSVILHHSLIHNLLDIFDKGNKVFLEMFL